MNQYPAQITITAYASDGSTVATGTKMITQARQNISMTAANYTKLTIRFDKTFLPKTRARLRQIDFGLTETYENDTMADVKIIEEASVSCESFPSRQISFTFDNADHRYNILNPDGVFSVVQDGQKLLARCIVNGESIDVGEFFLRPLQRAIPALRHSLSETIWLRHSIAQPMRPETLPRASSRL